MLEYRIFYVENVASIYSAFRLNMHFFLPDRISYSVVLYAIIIHGAAIIFTILETLLYTWFFKHNIFFKGTLLLRNFASFQNMYDFKTCDH